MTDLAQYTYRPPKKKVARAMTYPMTCARYAVLRVYQEYVSAHGYGPSERQLAEMTGVHQVTINRHTRALEAGGYIKKTGIPQLKWELVRSRLKEIKIDTSKYKTQSAKKSDKLYQLGYEYAVMDKVILN